MRKLFLLFALSPVLFSDEAEMQAYLDLRHANYDAVKAYRDHLQAKESGKFEQSQQKLEEFRRHWQRMRSKTPMVAIKTDSKLDGTPHNDVNGYYTEKFGYNPLEADEINAVFKSKRWVDETSDGDKIAMFVDSKNLEAKPRIMEVKLTSEMKSQEQVVNSFMGADKVQALTEMTRKGEIELYVTKAEVVQAKLEEGMEEKLSKTDPKAGAELIEARSSKLVGGFEIVQKDLNLISAKLDKLDEMVKNLENPLMASYAPGALKMIEASRIQLDGNFFMLHKVNNVLLSHQSNVVEQAAIFEIKSEGLKAMLKYSGETQDKLTMATERYETLCRRVQKQVGAILAKKMPAIKPPLPAIEPAPPVAPTVLPPPPLPVPPVATTPPAL